ncbi:hypothetical protein ABDB91_02345 [Desulfoscipio sp. XC116]|uniref:hypothetical protein n=1 Tax=Desulfoscipio sp. XC116 TaxID=3144975 RepID=UPI00325B81B4
MVFRIICQQLIVIYQDNFQVTPEQKLQIVSLSEGLSEERHIGQIASKYSVHVSFGSSLAEGTLESTDKVFATSKNAKAAAREKRKQEETIENHQRDNGVQRLSLWQKRQFSEPLSCRKFRFLIVSLITLADKAGLPTSEYSFNSL